MTNTLAFDRMVASDPWLTGVKPAAEVVPGMRPNLILHAAPPSGWAGMGGLMRGGMIGAALSEGLAATPEEAVAKAERGDIVFDAAQNFGAVAGGVGAITAGAPVTVVEDRQNGNRSMHPLMEGLGRTLVSGFYDAAVQARLTWFREDFGPTLDRAIAALGGIALRPLMTEALDSGDELHNRNRAANAAFVNRIALGLVEAGIAPQQQKQALTFLAANVQFFVCAVLPAAQLMLRAADGIAGSSVLTAIGGNGVDCGLRVSGLGDRWFTAPGEVPRGVLQAGVAPADVAPGCGDSFLIECAGLGAAVLPAAPAFMPVIGASPADALRFSDNARKIALGEHPHYRIAALDFRGAPVGVDVRKVVETKILPAIDIMMVGRKPGTGLVGMGVVSPPMRCFEAAVKALDAAEDPTRRTT
jgi:hypothetical protein